MWGDRNACSYKFIKRDSSCSWNGQQRRREAEWCRRKVNGGREKLMMGTCHSDWTRTNCRPSSASDCANRKNTHPACVCVCVLIGLHFHKMWALGTQGHTAPADRLSTKRRPFPRGSTFYFDFWSRGALWQLIQSVSDQSGQTMRQGEDTSQTQSLLLHCYRMWSRCRLIIWCVIDICV